MIGIVDYGLGNIRAFQNVYDKLGIPVRIIRGPKQLEDVTKIILPGVGSFDYAMRQLNRSGLRDMLERRVEYDRIPVLGICVGMQMLANSSEEGIESGLGWIKGRVCKFDSKLIPFKSRLPHMGWNSIVQKKNIGLFDGIENYSRFYFLHSYYFNCDDKSHELSTTDYGISYASAVNKDKIYGLQFHPEKSHQNGVRILNNFAQI